MGFHMVEGGFDDGLRQIVVLFASATVALRESLMEAAETKRIQAGSGERRSSEFAKSHSSVESHDTKLSRP